MRKAIVPDFVFYRKVVVETLVVEALDLSTVVSREETENLIENTGLFRKPDDDATQMTRCLS